MRARCSQPVGLAPLLTPFVSPFPSPLSLPRSPFPSLPPSSHPRSRIRYTAVDLATEDLRAAFSGVDIIVHSAGVVCLADNEALLYNTHVVATRNVIRCARQARSVRGLVFTSSGGGVTSPFCETPQLNVPNDFRPGDDFPFAR